MTLNEIKREFLYLSDQEASSVYYNKCLKHKPLHIADASGARKEPENTVPAAHNTIPPMSEGTVNNRIREGMRALRFEFGASLPEDYCRAFTELVDLLGDPPNWTKWPPPAPEEPPSISPPTTRIPEPPPERQFNLPSPTLTNILIGILLVAFLFGAWRFILALGDNTDTPQDPLQIANEGVTETPTPSITPDGQATNDAQRTRAAQTLANHAATASAQPTSTETPTPTITPSPTVTDTPTPTNTPTVPPTIPPPDFFDDFNTVIDTNVWFVENGLQGISIAQGQLSASGDLKMAVGDERWTDYVVEADFAQVSSGIERGNFIAVRKTSQSEIAIGIAGRSQSQMHILQNGNWSIIPNTLWNNPVGPRVMRVEVIGTSINVIINSSLVKNYQTTFPNGRVALKINRGTIVNSFRVSPVTTQ